jgi:hypothetical protein
MNRYEIWKAITNAYPALECFKIDGHKGYGYVKKDSLMNLAASLGVKIEG